MNNPKPKHTPGPWAVMEHMDSGNIKIGSDQGAVAIASWGRQHRDTLTANARLIATAPELLEALKIISKLESDADGYFILNEIGMNIINRAIAKAEGRES